MERQVKAYTRKGKNGKVIRVAAHTRKCEGVSGAKGSAELLKHYDQFNNEYLGRRVGKPFSFSDDGGDYDAHFVANANGRYGVVLRDKEEGPKGNYYVAVDAHLDKTVRKVAKSLGLKYSAKEDCWRKIAK